jgi:hypothetical protein
MRKLASLLAFSAVLVCGQAFAANTYHVDPNAGTSDGDGSSARPWKTLEEVAAKGLLKKLQGGDTVLLHTGYHGEVTFSGANDSMVTIAPGERPTLSRLTIPSGKNWCVRGLVISPSLGKTPYTGAIVSFGDGGESSKITIEDCYIFSVEDASAWDAKQWMNTYNGVVMGRGGRDLTLRNNYIRNTRFGVSLEAFDSLCEGNIISDFSGDGMRATRDGEVVQYNIIKNVYVSAADGDKNHDDGIQVFLFNKGTGTVKNMKFIGNIIIAHEDPNQKWINALQGLGFFDGPLVDFVVTDNVVNVDSYHGISLYDAQNARVERNVVWAPDSQKVRPWIKFGGKENLAKDNVAKNNFSSSYYLKQPGTVEEKNEASTAKIYDEAMKRALKTICDKFGEKHVAANCPRLVIK